MKCNLCPRQCNSKRTEKDNQCGYCNMPLQPKVARAALHFWEEPCISGTNGSGTVFFSGCNLGCVFCQNTEISQQGKGRIISIEQLADIFKRLESEGAHNINLVTPTHYVTAIMKALEIYKPSVPIVYNSGGYEDVNIIRSLKDYIDVYLIDYKFYTEDKAKRYANAPEYPIIAQKAIIEAYKQKENTIIKDGIMKSGVIVRHLLLPQATNDAIKIFDWVRKNTPNAYFSFMGQYIPCGLAKNMDVINRKVTKREYQKVLDYITKSGFENCYFQELTSADERYIPPFDLTGV